MEKSHTFKRAKGPYLKNIHHEKFYDLTSNLNILGHSFKTLTTYTKNDISSAWNITGNSSYHIKFKKLIEKLFGKDYLLTSCFSLIEFFSRFSAYAQQSQIKIKITGNNFKNWFERFIIPNENKKNIKEINIIDMAKFYIECAGNTAKIKEKIKLIANDKILNYFWYPELILETFNSDIIILPEIYSGNFKYINILIKKNSSFLNESQFISNDIGLIPSLYISTSLKNYYLIKKNDKTQIIKLKWKNFTQAERIFIYDKTDQDYSEVINSYKKYKILLNEYAPYYNYLPIILDENQKNYLSRIKS
ncbi:MAG: hypothetical protein JXB50_06080 [Spirochaetes bacterium]|nr:hypothetical protein [Spirochaetota bacterium]